MYRRLWIPGLIAAIAAGLFSAQVAIPLLWIVAAPALLAGVFMVGQHYPPALSTAVFFVVTCGWLTTLFSPMLFRARPFSRSTLGWQLAALIGAALVWLVCVRVFMQFFFPHPD